jgi:hypothetical protein
MNAPPQADDDEHIRELALMLANTAARYVERVDVVISDLEALLGSEIPLPALAKQMIRSSVATLKGAGR